MMRYRAFMLLSGVALQGCAAAAIPLATGALMAGRERVTAAAADEPAPVPGPGAAAPAAAQPADPPATGYLPQTLDALRQAGLASGLQPAAQAGSDDSYARFANYALALAGRPLRGDEALPSALLARPGLLVPEREPCRLPDYAVLVDLDPAGGALDTGNPPGMDGLADALKRLRGAGIKVVWSTALTADRAGDVRGWLRRGGLDPAGEDNLLMLRYTGDRKQTRRKDASQTHCLIALLGDERSDFDELFDYLKQPDAAVALDAMLDEGWFLAPVPAAAPNDEGPQE